MNIPALNIQDIICAREALKCFDKTIMHYNGFEKCIIETIGDGIIFRIGVADLH